ncbi:glycosyltransferase family 39 protein [Aquabacterium sp.]|uniref:glycosyltransferase family 39 protein n=1 Tax=Aquabacterium sp. TaxID=1872578 RepID=UPI0035B012CF
MTRGLRDRVLMWGGWLALWLVLSLVVCLTMPGGRSDDAEILQHVQFLAPGYRLRNPPLFEWISWSVMTLTGPSMAVVLCLRVGCVALMMALLYKLGRVLSLSTWGALAAALSVGLVPNLYYYALFDLTHTVLAGVFYVALPLAVLWARAQPSVVRMAVLGLMGGLGLLTKHVFVIYVAAALLSCAVVPSFRRLLQPRHLLVAVVVAVLVVSPYALWVIQQGADAFHMQQQESLHVDGHGSPSRLMVVVRLLSVVAAVVLPWMVWRFLFIGRALWQVAPGPARDQEAVRWLTWTLGVTLLLMLLIWMAQGAQRLEPHHVYFLALAPVAWAASFVQVDTPKVKRLAWATLVWTAVVVPLVFAVNAHKTASRCRECGPYVDYPELARHIGEAGLTQGTLYYASHTRLLSVPALVPYLPGVQMVRVDVPASESPVASRQGACGVIWQPGKDRWQQSPPDSLPVALRDALAAGQPVAVQWTVRLATTNRDAQTVSLIVLPKGCP